MFCVLSPGEDLMSPGAVLEVARRGGGEEVTSARQMSPVEAKLSVDVSLSVARRGGGDRDYVFN
ncbi:hypothetical protein A2U01_0080648 [Trifolium medium]|uniref:Uncharacterized protein n=1 Tax=Trifolium medium TaxID=97028 RepID=A0A392TE06_9FABA|nr:hypothetical protein [Trifolium medium]